MIVAFRWVVKKSNLLFTWGSNKDQRIILLTHSVHRPLFGKFTVWKLSLEHVSVEILEILNLISRFSCFSDIKYIFLVGGFAESPMLQQEIRQEFGHLLKIIIPQDVGLTILKGTVRVSGWH